MMHKKVVPVEAPNTIQKLWWIIVIIKYMKTFSELVFSFDDTLMIYF